MKGNKYRKEQVTLPFISTSSPTHLHSLTNKSDVEFLNPIYLQEGVNEISFKKMKVTCGNFKLLHKTSNLQ